jgi:hypothetical protein
VTKRYSDFDRLKKALVADVPEVKKWVLPRKTLPGKKDSEKTIQARKEGLAKFMASIVAVAGAHEAVQVRLLVNIFCFVAVSSLIFARTLDIGICDGRGQHLRYTDQRRG